MPKVLPDPTLRARACARACVYVQRVLIRNCATSIFDKHQNMASKACLCTLQIIVVNIIECSHILYEGCSNMIASSFITFVTYMLRQNGIRFYKK